ncbi:MAG: transcription termination/antitermination factor NusG [Clostridia bacterium]|nr:transcription termination/antitermination factor NusG [Clostridia bacterium]
MSNQAKAEWFVLHTYSGYENKVAANIEKIVENRGLHDLIFETRIPTETVITDGEMYDDYVEGQRIVEYDDDGNEKPKKGPRTETHKLFPSYVLIKMIMNDESWHIVRNITGVTGFVGPGSRPVPLSEAEVEALGVDLHVAEIKFEIGESVYVVAGPFAGSIVTVKEIDNDSRRIKVSLIFGGKESVVDMDVKDVEPIKD